MGLLKIAGIYTTKRVAGKKRRKLIVRNFLSSSKLCTDEAAILHNGVMVQKPNECCHNYPLCNLALVF
jgi:hypothetical protein